MIPFQLFLILSGILLLTEALKCYNFQGDLCSATNSTRWEAEECSKSPSCLKNPCEVCSYVEQVYDSGATRVNMRCASKHDADWEGREAPCESYKHFDWEKPQNAKYKQRACQCTEDLCNSLNINIQNNVTCGNTGVSCRHLQAGLLISGVTTVFIIFTK